jgi:hypothetical protein
MKGAQLIATRDVQDYVLVVHQLVEVPAREPALIRVLELAPGNAKVVVAVVQVAVVDVLTVREVVLEAVPAVAPGGVLVVEVLVLQGVPDAQVTIKIRGVYYGPY